MAEAIETTGDITRTGVTMVNVADPVIPTDTVITGNAAKAAHPEAVQWKDALPLFPYPSCARMVPPFSRNHPPRAPRCAVTRRNLGGGSARIAAVPFKPKTLLKEQAGSPFQGPFNSPTYP